MALTPDKDWWRQAVIYQIYPRSFKDSNGDGIGDIKGITSQVGYLQSLNLDAIWLSPFYPSALADGGYDVDDYRDVDPKLGTLADFDEMLEKLHNVGIRVFVDIVPNHSSNRHQWFQEAIKSPPGSAARNRYIFRDGKGVAGELPPTNWISHFAPSAWSHESTQGGSGNQWYCHLFAPEQPDFNWDNSEVEAEFLTTLKFWADRGVDGFRIDVAHMMKKDLSEPLKDAPEPVTLDSKVAGNEILFDRDEVHEVFKSWRKLFNQYNPPRVAVAEAWAKPENIHRYASPDELGQAFNFDLLLADFDANTYREIVTRNLADAKNYGSSSTWVFSNHDQVRPATRYGLPRGVNLIAFKNSNGKNISLDVERGLNASIAAQMFALALPGCTYIYQGEELGLPEALEIPEDQIQDPQYLRNHKVDKGRDGCRVPLPWSRSGASLGFGSAGAHLPQPEIFARYSVEAESGVAGSPLEIFRKALALRKDLLTGEELLWHKSGDSELLHFSRPNGWHCLTNFGNREVSLPAELTLIHSSQPLASGQIPGATTAWARG
jgi:alpha-glucosidase